MLMRLWTAGQAALKRVFVRSTLYSVGGVLVFSFIFVALSYFSQISEIHDRLERNAQEKAQFVANISAREIENKNYGEMERLLNAVAGDRYVIAAKAYSRFGQEFASDFSSSKPVSEIQFNEDALNAAQTGKDFMQETADTIEYILPVFRGGAAVGSVLVRMSKEEMGGILDEAFWQAAVLVGLLFLAFLPVAGWLMYRATAGISEVTQAANEAAEGYLDCSLETEARGEVGELQSAFLQMMRKLRSNIIDIERLAYTDRITGLANRAKLDKLAVTMIDLKPKAAGSVLYIGLDRFKMINDMHGHLVGDKLLRQLAERLERLIDKVAHPHTESAPAVARFSGDEFVCILPGLTDPAVLNEVCETILKLLNRPVRIGSLSLSVSASAGVVTYPEQGETAAEIMKNAYLAMYHAKSTSRGRVVAYNEDLRAQINERENVAERLRHALDNQSLKVFYQPKVNPSNGKIVGSEALLRWDDEVLGKVPPVKFIPIAEERGLITPIGQFVLRQALEDTRQLHRQNLDMSIAVNVSPAQLQDANFTDHMLGIIGESGLPTDKLELEITESSLINYSETVLRQIQPIRDEGVKFAIDDFGTGYSCLNSLASMPFDTLKIDRSFIMEIANSQDGRTIVELILIMARQLNLNTVAEGVETPLQKDYLNLWGGTLGQGYLWSPPVPQNEYAALVCAQGGGSLEPKAASGLH